MVSRTWCFRNFYHAKEHFSIKCKEEYSENCFRDHHFNWCVEHGKMLRKGGECPEKDGGCDYVEFGECFLTL